MFETQKNKSIKITLLGDGGTGKSSFFTRLRDYENLDYRFDKRYKTTNDFDFIRLKLKTNNGLIKVDLWDTAGQENAIGGINRDAYIKGSDAVIIMYDITNNETIDHIQKWLNDVKETCGNIPVAVCGNKIDKYPDVSMRKCKLFRKSQLKTMYYGNSYFTTDNINNFFISVKENTNYDLHNYNEDGTLIPFNYVLSTHLNRKTIVQFENEELFNDDL